MKGFMLCLFLTACAAATVQPAGCAAYAEARLTMPRPLEDTPLGRWVAVLDNRLMGVCRG